MKLGTFVGKKFLKSTEAEKQYILNAIANRFDKNSVEFEQSTIMSFFKIRIFDGVSNYRLGNGSLVNPQYIKIGFVSQYGYDEAEVGKFYEWKDGFTPAYDIHSYSITIDIIGNERPYRCKTVNHYVGIRQTDYKYGTEMDDLELESSLDNLVKFINRMYSQKVKNNII